MPVSPGALIYQSSVPHLPPVNPNPWTKDHLQKWEQKALVDALGKLERRGAYGKGELILQELSSLSRNIPLFTETHPVERLVDTSPTKPSPNDALMIADLMEYAGALPVVQNWSGVEEKSTVHNFISALVNPGREQHIAALKVPFTEEGLGKLKLKIPEEYFHNAHCYLSEKLETRSQVIRKEALTSVDVKLGTSQEQTDVRPLEFQWYTSIIPTGTITDIRQNGVGVTTLICEIQEQNKIWLFWPPTERNRATFRKYDTSSKHTAVDLECIRHMKEMMVYVAMGTEPRMWGMAPGVFYATITFATSYHFSCWLCDRDDWDVARQLLWDRIASLDHPRFSHIPPKERFQDMQLDVYNWATSISKEEDPERRVKMAKEMQAVIDVVGFTNSKNPLDVILRDEEERRKRKAGRGEKLALLSGLRLITVSFQPTRGRVVDKEE